MKFVAKGFGNGNETELQLLTAAAILQEVEPAMV